MGNDHLTDRFADAGLRLQRATGPIGNGPGVENIFQMDIRRARRWDLLPIHTDIQRVEAHAQRCNEKQVPLHGTVITVRRMSVQMFAAAAGIPCTLLPQVSVECH